MSVTRFLSFFLCVCVGEQLKSSAIRLVRSGEEMWFIGECVR